MISKDLSYSFPQFSHFAIQVSSAVSSDLPVSVAVRMGKRSLFGRRGSFGNLVTGQVNAPDPIPVKRGSNEGFHRCHDSPAMLNLSERLATHRLAEEPEMAQLMV
jgi:hypothetical protein